MLKDQQEYYDELEKLEHIVNGNQTHDVHGSPIVPPNYYQLKHAAKEKEQNLARIYQIIALSGIPWEDVVKYVESDPPTTGDRVQRHRHRAAKMRIAQENLKRAAEARRGKQAKTTK